MPGPGSTTTDSVLGTFFHAIGETFSNGAAYDSLRGAVLNMVDTTSMGATNLSGDYGALFGNEEAYEGGQWVGEGWAYFNIATVVIYQAPAAMTALTTEAASISLPTYGWIMTAEGTAVWGITGSTAVSVTTAEALAMTWLTMSMQFPGTDPTVAPEGFEWNGKPGSQPGSKQGNFYNRQTGESLRPDLNHPDPIDPHWDYKDALGKWWRIFANGIMEAK